MMSPKATISARNAGQPTRPTASAPSTANSTAAPARTDRARRRGARSRTAVRASSAPHSSRNAASSPPAVHAPALIAVGETPPISISCRSAASPRTRCASPRTTAPPAETTAAAAATVRLPRFTARPPRFTPRTLLLGRPLGKPSRAAGSPGKVSGVSLLDLHKSPQALMCRPDGDSARTPTSKVDLSKARTLARHGSRSFLWQPLTARVGKVTPVGDSSPGVATT